MTKITERTYNAIVKRLRKYMIDVLPQLDGDEIGWYGDVDNLETTGTYAWRAYNPDTNKSYKLVIDWSTKKITHEEIAGDIWARF